MRRSLRFLVVVLALTLLPLPLLATPGSLPGRSESSFTDRADSWFRVLSMSILGVFEAIGGTFDPNGEPAPPNSDIGGTFDPDDLGGTFDPNG